MLAKISRLCFLASVLFLISLKANSQVKGVVVDKATRKPVAYCNIWVEYKQAGTTSDDAGRFALANATDTDTLRFSAMGYESRRVAAGTDTIFLQPTSVLLSEVVVRGRKNTRHLRIGLYKKGKVSYYLGSGGYPRMVARYFPYNQVYKQTAFLKQLRILTASDIDNALFHVRLYRAQPDGKPGEYLHEHSIVGVARKGKNNTTIDVADLTIRFPEEGLFVAIEWLIIDQNKHVYKTAGKKPASLIGNSLELARSSYQPLVGTLSSDRDENSWMLTSGSWQKVTRTKSPLTSEVYNLPAIELVLSN